ncbi:MAG: tyrosine-protein kinase [Actinomycetota bacterium]|jgi:capsular exopolysaccharide synthesis family protein|nr:tyrosine-protein kinase [Actinomycetota bacterium]
MPPPPASGLRAHLVVWRAHKRLIFACVALAVGGSLLFSSRQSKIYQSESDVLVTPIQVAAGQPTTATAPNMDTEKSVAASEAVATGAARLLHGSVDPTDLLKHLSVEVPAGTEILSFKYSDNSPTVAQGRAKAFVKAYLTFRQQQAERELAAAARPLQRELQNVTQELATTNKQLAGATTTARADALKQRVNALNTRKALVEQRISDLTPSSSLDVGTVLRGATRPLSASNRSPLLEAILALFVGLLLGLGGAYLRDRLDDRLWTEESLEHASGAASIGTIPFAARLLMARKPMLINMPDTDQAFTESYRTLRTSVLSAVGTAGAKTLMVTSAVPNEGKTTLTVNLAIAIAGTGKKVILVSADMRLPRAAEMLSINEEPGLANVLADGTPLSDALHLSGVQNFQVVPSGRTLADPSEWLGSDAMSQLLQDLSKRADIVLVDATPVLGMADALTLAPKVDGVILVCGAGVSSAKEVRDAARKLTQLGAAMIGCALNGFVSYRAAGYGDSDYYRAAWTAADSGANRST